MAELDWDKEMVILSQCAASVDTSSIPEKNAVCEFEFDEFKELFLKPSGTKRKGDRILVGVHPPSISPVHFYKETVRETTTITQRCPSSNVNQSNNGMKSMNGSVHEPPSKKRKFTDWRTGNNKPYDDQTDDDRKSRSVASKMTKAVKRHSNGSVGGDTKIPPGLESCFDPETGSLVEALKSCDPEMVKRIGYDLMSTDTETTFADIAGLSAEKESIREAVIWPLERADIYANNGLLEPPKGVLLFGPPGTGKTMIAKAIANESGAHFFAVSPSSLTSKWLGESAKLIKAMFAVARCVLSAVVIGPTLLFHCILRGIYHEFLRWILFPKFCDFECSQNWFRTHFWSHSECTI